MSLSITNWLNSLEIKPIGEQPSPCEKKKGDCLKVIQYILDGEATDEQQKHFAKHILACIPCFEQYHLDKSIKLALQTKICKKEVPPNLVEEIRIRIGNIA